MLRRSLSVRVVLLLITPRCHAMRLVVQRVNSASVTVKSKTVSSIGRGVVALVGLHERDGGEDLKYCAKKLCGAKLWPNQEGKLWRQSVRQMQYDVLLVSQFTLYGDVSNKKHSPDFKLSMKSDAAREAYAAFKAAVAAEYDADRVHDGEFGASMAVELVNDGPVTIVIDSPDSPVADAPTAGAMADAAATTGAPRSTDISMSWGDADWQWGSASGAAHKEAARMRAALATPDARAAFLAAAADGGADLEECKLALALACQRAAKRCYAKDYGLDADEQAAWRELIDAMADGGFEGHQGDARLAAAIGERLGLSERARLASLCALSAPRASVVSAMRALSFVEQKL